MKNKKLLRTITLLVIFLIVGVFNTVNITIQDFGSYRHYIGIGFLLLALIELIIMIKKLFPGKSPVGISDEG